MDMLHGPLAGKLFCFALPIALSSMLQQLFNAADTSIVGRFADSNALAAVGTNGEIVALLVTLSAGLAVGANVRIAQCIGEKNTQNISGILHTSLVLALLLGVLGGILIQWIARPLLVLIHTPSEILDAATVYLRIYGMGLPFLMLYDFGSAILRAKGNSKLPFLILMASGFLNVLLNLLFVIVCKMNVAGVAIATDLSTAVSAFCVLWALHRETAEFHFSPKAVGLQPSYSRQMLAIGIPAAIQGAVFCFANIFVQASVNSFGAVATAGTTIAMNFEYFGYYMITAFGQTATTFTSQNFAAKAYDRCRKILLLCLALSFILSACITVPLTVFRVSCSGIFSPDALVIEAACVRIMLILIFEPICTFYEIPAGVLRGAGHAALPSVLTVIGTCLLRIVWIFTVFRKFHTLEVLFVIFPISWVVTILLTAVSWIICKPLTPSH